MLVECINDTNWPPAAIKNIIEFPVKGNIYTVIGRNHTSVAGMGYVIEELRNPPLPCGSPVGFSAKRFKPIQDIDISEIKMVIEEMEPGQFETKHKYTIEPL